MDKIERMNGVLNITQLHFLGDTIKNDGTLSRLCLRIHITANSYDEMKNSINTINDTIIIEDENGRDMILERKYL